MGVTGDFSKLAKLVQHMEAVADRGHRRELTKQVGQELLARVQTGFERSVAPGGAAWAPLKKRQGQPLLLTGRLRNSLHARTDADAVTISSDVAYAAIHQFGGDITRPARVNGHARSGRFLSRAQAASARRKLVRISFSPGGTTHIPARPFLPRGGLSPEWRAAVDQVVEAWMEDLFR